MIRPTETDIGRRVLYRTSEEKARGKLVGIESERIVLVLFDGAAMPLRVISNLEWADK